MSDVTKRLTKEELMLAISRGVSDAIWRIANNATDMPCTDFYDAIQKGAADGVGRMSRPD